MKVEFSGDPADVRAQVVEYLKSSTPTGEISQLLNVPENVVRQVIYEFVASENTLNEYYIVTLVNDETPISCTCKDFHYRIRKQRERGVQAPRHRCKHMRQAEVRHKAFR